MMDWLSLLFIAGPMTLLYYFQVKHEEKHLAGAFPSLWPTYTARTRASFPTNSTRIGAVAGPLPWLRNREYQAILGVGIGLAGLMLLKLMNW